MKCLMVISCIFLLTSIICSNVNGENTYPDLRLSDSGFFTNANYEFIDGQCNHYDEAPLNVCMGYEESEYYVTCQDTENIVWYKYSTGDCVSDTETPATNSIGSGSIVIADINDNSITATCNAVNDCKYFNVNNFRVDESVLLGFCYGAYTTYEALMIDACYTIPDSSYSAMWTCDGSLLSGTGYATSDCTGDAVTSFTDWDYADTKVYNDDQAIEKCYQFICNGVVTTSHDDVVDDGSDSDSGDSDASGENGDSDSDTGDSQGDSEGDDARSKFSAMNLLFVNLFVVGSLMYAVL